MLNCIQDVDFLSEHLLVANKSKKEQKQTMENQMNVNNQIIQIISLLRMNEY